MKNDRWREIGSVLKKKRENLGYDIAQVAFNLGISMHRIKYMEEGRFDEVDDPVYVRTYIKRYADFLGLNGDELARRYWETITGKREHRESKPLEIQNRESEVKLEGFPILTVFLYTVVFVEIVIALLLYNAIVRIKNTPTLLLKNTSGHVLRVDGEELEPGGEYVIKDNVKVMDNEGEVIIKSYSGSTKKIKIKNFEVVVRGGFGKIP